MNTHKGNCISCGVPKYLHGTCCGWANSNTIVKPLSDVESYYQSLQKKAGNYINVSNSPMTDNKTNNQIKKVHEAIVHGVEDGRITHGEYAGIFYPIVGCYDKTHPLRYTHLLIEDEPNHKDSINISSFTTLKFDDKFTIESHYLSYFLKCNHQ